MQGIIYHDTDLRLEKLVLQGNLPINYVIFYISLLCKEALIVMYIESVIIGAIWTNDIMIHSTCGYRRTLTLKFDRATLPFLKIDMRHQVYRHGGILVT